MAVCFTRPVLQELAALSRVNPAQLAAQASANSRLAREASAASSPDGSSPAAGISPEIMESLAKIKGPGYGASIPPGLDLAGGVISEILESNIDLGRNTYKELRGDTSSENGNSRKQQAYAGAFREHQLRSSFDLPALKQDRNSNIQASVKYLKCADKISLL